MLMAHPAVLKTVIAQYETLRVLHAEEGDAALIAARYGLPGALVEDDSLLAV
ncbi:DUF5133 domain-containing protein [Streptomyces sp. NPDC004237]|uniref:DUF5133 domain-containing protein n=1 Tax=Streptomyces sp. NPDC004237 TaxID=3154455 RepID=UPI0033B31210